MSDDDVIMQLHRTAGFGTVISNKQRKSYKPTWTWRSECSQDVFDFEAMIFPYLGSRRKQQILASHELRRDYELTSTGNNIRRIFTTDSGQLLPYPEVFSV